MTLLVMTLLIMTSLISPLIVMTLLIMEILIMTIVTTPNMVEITYNNITTLLMTDFTYKWLYLLL